MNDNNEMTEQELAYMAETTVHPQVHVSHGRFEADVDVEIAPLILGIWEHGIETVMSCIGTPSSDPVWAKWQRVLEDKGIEACHPVWIEFPEQEDVLEFLTIVARDYDREPESLYNRICGEWQSEKPHWDIGVNWPRDMNVQYGDMEIVGKAEPDMPPVLAFSGWSVRFPYEDLDEVARRLHDSAFVVS